MTTKKKLHVDVYIAIIFLLFSGFMFALTFGMSVSAGRYARLVTGVAMALAIMYLFSGIRKSIIDNKATSKADAFKGPQLDDNEFSWRLFKGPLIVFLIMVVYVFLMNYIHFFPATILFVPGLMWYLGVRSWKTLLLTTAGINLFIYLLFIVELNVQLP